MPDISKTNILTRAYAWFSALASDDAVLLDDLLAHGVPIDTPHPLRHSTALMEATRLGRAGMVQWLLERGAAPAFLCGLPLGTSLHYALRHHHWNIAQILANAMDSCAVMDAYGATPLHVLSSESLDEKDMGVMLGLATLFITRQCPLNALDHEGTTALHHCVINDYQPLCTMLLRHGANPNAMIPDSQVSPLTIAALEKNMAMAQLLLQFGADPHIRTRDGATPLSLYPSLASIINASQGVRSDGPRAKNQARALAH
jgi:ankyrin repeat protein